MTTFKEYLDVVTSGEETNLVSIMRGRNILSELPKPPTPDQVELIEKAKSAGLRLVGDKLPRDLFQSYRRMYSEYMCYREYVAKRTLAEQIGVPVESLYACPEQCFTDYEKPKRKEREDCSSGSRSGRFYHNLFHPDADNEAEYLIVNQYGEWILASRQEKAREGCQFSISVDELLDQLNKHNLI